MLRASSCRVVTLPRGTLPIIVAHGIDGIAPYDDGGDGIVHSQLHMLRRPTIVYKVASRELAAVVRECSREQ